MPTQEAVQKFCLFFAKTPPQLISREARKGVQTITTLISDAGFKANELRGNVRRTDDCRRKLNHSRGEKLAEEGFGKETAKSGRAHHNKTVLYKKNVLAVLQAQMAMSSLQDVFQLARGSKRDSPVIQYAAWSEYKMICARESAGVKNKRLLME